MSDLAFSTKYEPDPQGSGRWINSDFRRLAEVIQDYDPTMYLSWIPDEQRLPTDTHPFCVVHAPFGTQPYVIFYLTEVEMQRPDQVLARILAGDLRKGDVFDRMEKERKAAELLRLKELQDEIEAKKDFARSLLASPKHTYRHNGKVYE